MAQNLFIGGLSFSTSTEALRDTFGQAGHVESAAVVTDRDTGHSRGFGFVEMSTDARSGWRRPPPAARPAVAGHRGEAVGRRRT